MMPYLSSLKETSDWQFGRHPRGNGDFEQRELTGVITALLPKPIEEALIIIARFV